MLETRSASDNMADYQKVIGLTELGVIINLIRSRIINFC